MTPDRWSALTEMIKNSFKVLAEYREELEPGKAEIIEFETAQGKFQARFVQRPRVVNKKTLYSNRSGSSVSVDYDYDAEDLVSHLELFSWNEDRNDWIKLDASSMFPV